MYTISIKRIDIIPSELGLGPGQGIRSIIIIIIIMSNALNILRSIAQGKTET